MRLQSPFQSSFHSLHHGTLDRCLVCNLLRISRDLLFAEAQLVKLLLICSVSLPHRRLGLLQLAQHFAIASLDEVLDELDALDDDVLEDPLPLVELVHDALLHHGLAEVRARRLFQIGAEEGLIQVDGEGVHLGVVEGRAH